MAVLVGLEVELVKVFGWSLRDIDETDITSLVGFLGGLNPESESETQTRGKKMVYCDEVSWL